MMKARRISVVLKNLLFSKSSFLLYIIIVLCGTAVFLQNTAISIHKSYHLESVTCDTFKADPDNKSKKNWRTGNHHEEYNKLNYPVIIMK